MKKLIIVISIMFLVGCGNTVGGLTKGMGKDLQDAGVWIEKQYNGEQS